jgi:hypothetical protein
MHEEYDVKKGIILLIGALAFLAGCKDQGPQIQIPPKWQGAAYHLSFGAPPAKPNPAGLTIPPIKWVADPESLQTRADLVIEFDSSTAKGQGGNGPVTNQMAMGAVDISGAEGQLPTDYVDKASTDLSKMIGAYCMKGKIKISVALVHPDEPNRRPDQRQAPVRLDADRARLQESAPEVLGRAL